MHTFIIVVMSADGFIAPANTSPLSPSTTWTSSEDKAFFIQKTKAAGVVIMGKTTYFTFPPKYRPLKDRINIIYTTQPESIPNSQPLTPTSSLTATTPLITSLPPLELVNLLKAKDQKQLAILGGTSIYTQFIKAQVVDTLYLTVEPTLFGQGTPIFNQPLNINLQLVNTHPLSHQTLVLEYNIQY